MEQGIRVWRGGVWVGVTSTGSWFTSLVLVQNGIIVIVYKLQIIGSPYLDIHANFDNIFLNKIF